MRPESLKTKIFLDGGDPEETKKIIGLLGFLDGQTTNPTLIARNPQARERLQRGEKFHKEEILDFYNSVVREISGLMPQGSVSIEVYSDLATPAGEMLGESEEMYSWIPNAHIKFPITTEGLKAAELAVKKGMRVNMTLCFTQEQAAAVCAATTGAKKGDVFVSPFVGRLDDRGENGMDLIANIIKMYRAGNAHVEVLAASVRTFDHFLYSLKLGADIITAPFAVLNEWGEKGMPLPGEDYHYIAKELKNIPYNETNLANSWQNYDIHYDLTTSGLERFSIDWNSLIA